MTKTLLTKASRRAEVPAGCAEGERIAHERAERRIIGMATKKTAKPAEAEEQLLEQQETEPEQPEEVKAEPADPWAETMDVVVPRKPKGEDQQFYVCVNDRRFYIPANGQVQTLPKPIALVLQDTIQAEYAAEDFADHIPNRSGEMPQPHSI